MEVRLRQRKAQMTRNNYEAFASMLAKFRPNGNGPERDVWENVRDGIGIMCAQDNPRFSMVRFVMATLDGEL